MKIIVKKRNKSTMFYKLLLTILLLTNLTKSETTLTSL